MGFLVRNAHKTQNESDQYYDATGNITLNQVLGTASNPHYYDGTFGPYGPMTDYGKIQSITASQLQSGFAPNLDKDHITSDPATWGTTERVYAGYLMDSISFGKLRLVGGLRIEGTTTDFNANQVNLSGGAYVSTVPVKGNSGYVNFMPSIQATYLIEANTKLRLSYSRGISRPNFSDLVPSVQVDPNATPKSLQVGNPNLLPTKANNYDILIEHYFQPLGILQAGFFYKALTDPIYATASFVSQSDPNFPGYLRQQSINGPSAHIAGFEMAWQQRLSFLPGLLNGIGVAANYSYAASQVTFPVGFSSTVAGGQGRIDHPALQRQAPNTWNLGFTYDKRRFSMRFGVSHNDANIYAYQYVHDPTNPTGDKDPILGIKGPLGDQYLYAHTQFDVQGSYRFYKGLQFVVSGLNLSNEVFGFYTGSAIYPNQREYYKPTVIVGMRWSSAPIER
jgi:TonB-dependent receptor